MSSITITRLQLARELEALRVGAGENTTFVAEEVLRLKARNTYRRYETGEIRPPWPHLEVLMNRWGVEGEDRRRLTELWEQADQKAWWSKYRLEGINKLLGFESMARKIRAFEPSFVFGPLQTADYARALMRGMDPPGTSEDQIEHKVQLRLERQDRIYKVEDPPELQILLDEAVLRRQIGDDEVMADQLEWLASLSEPCELRVLPFDSGAHPGMTGAFWLIDFPPDLRKPVVYIDGPHRTLCLDDETSVADASLAFDRLWELALNPAESRSTLRKVITRRGRR